MAALPLLNYFDYFCLQRSYLLDKLLLTNTYKSYQKVLHPDKFHLDPPLLEGATRVSAFTSTAYSTLMDDILRAEYLL